MQVWTFVSPVANERNKRNLCDPSFTRAIYLRVRAALTGKHDTLVRRAPGWQGAPDGQQAKKLVVTKCLFYIINVSI